MHFSISSTICRSLPPSLDCSPASEMGSYAVASKSSICAVSNAAPVGSHEPKVKSTQRRLQRSKLQGPCSLQRSKFFSSASECRILARRKLCKSLRHSSRLSQSPTIVCQRDSLEEESSHLHVLHDESSPRCSSSSSDPDTAMCDHQASLNPESSEVENPVSCSTVTHSNRGNFRVGRRLLLGAVAAGLSVYYPLSSERARAADKGFKFSLNKGSWFLGDSESDPASGDTDSGAVGKSGSRVYDATVLGEPIAIGSDKDRVWTRLLENRVVFLGEAETVADSDDKLLELEIVKTLRDKCFEQRRSVSVAFQAFPIPLQPQLNAYMNNKLTDEDLRAVASHLSEDRWLEYVPILQYCRNNGVRLVACGAPLEVLRTVQAKGVQALNKADTEVYIPPAGGGYKFKSSPLDDVGSVDIIPNSSGPFGPGPYRFAQARVVEDYTMAQVVTQIIRDGGAVGLLLVITGASHVKYGARGMGLPSWIAKNKEMQKRTQSVVLLNPERQQLRKEGDVPEADFLWYSAAKVCTRNCFDRAEVARVMGAAGRRREALPQDLQVGLQQGLVAPEVLENFFELEQNPLMAELTDRFQGLRERWLADPRFLQRLAIEETISITTTLLAQYERRGTRFWQELDYVATDSIRGAVVDFFTVWLPAPRLSFRELDPNEAFNALDSLKGLLGSFPDNAFQRAQAGQSWGLSERVGGIIVGGVKLFAVGFISSVGTVAGTNLVLGARQLFSQEAKMAPKNKRSPILKTALVYGSFLGTSANLRYQAIAGVIEHWVADYWLASQPLAGSVLSFVARVANSYFGTGQWIDLARFAGLQAHGETESSSNSTSEGDTQTSIGPSTSATLVESIEDKTGSTDQLQENLKQWIDLARLVGVQAHGETESSSNSTSEGDTQTLIGTSTSATLVEIESIEDKTGSTDQLQENLKVPK